MSFSHPTRQQFLEYKQSLEQSLPFNIFADILHHYVDQEQTPVSQADIFLRVMSLAQRQMLLVVSEEVREILSQNLQELEQTKEISQQEYLSFVLGQLQPLWPRILRGTLNTVFEITLELSIPKEEEMFVRLSEFVDTYSQTQTA